MRSIFRVWSGVSDGISLALAVVHVELPAVVDALEIFSIELVRS